MDCKEESVKVKIAGNKEFETCVIGACLRDAANLPVILETLRGRDFSSPNLHDDF